MRKGRANMRKTTSFLSIIQFNQCFLQSTGGDFEKASGPTKNCGRCESSGKSNILLYVTSSSDPSFEQPRDPRFLSVAGEFSDRKFQEQYGFLADIHSTELKTLRENLKRARKLLGSTPRDIREERQREVARLELAVKRAESSVNKDRREMVEQKALFQVAKEEREKRKSGKGGWWMKECMTFDLRISAF